MPARRALLLAVSISFLLLASVSPALANDQAGSKHNGSNNGLRGSNNIRTNPATIQGISYVHANQLLFADSANSWLAVGTYKGAGAGGPGGSCSSQYSTNWAVYTDGERNGLYFCTLQSANRYTVGDIPPIQISHGFCTTSQNGWGLKLGGVQWSCLNNGNQSSNVAASFIETAGSDGTCRNIDMKFFDMQVRVSGSWQDFAGPGGTYKTASCYTVDWATYARFNAYSGVLD